MTSKMLLDLAKSGLVDEDIMAKEAGGSEFAAVNAGSNAEGYVIPYYDISGARLPFYRVKLFTGDVKYKQPKNTTNQIYFPPNFLKTFKNNINSNGLAPYVILTEGEKKAACAVKAGIAACAVGGVDSWVSRTLVLPSDTKIESLQKRGLKIKLPSSSREELDIADGIADLVHLCLAKGATLIIVYDTENAGINPQVQRAAAMLGYELCHLGMPMNSVKQLLLPSNGITKKVGLDDYLVSCGAEQFKELVKGCLQNRFAFPRHPNPKHYLNRVLANGRLKRTDKQRIAVSVLSELDARGRRMVSSIDESPYYFDEDNKRLIPAQLMSKNGTPLHESKFGPYLYQMFGLTAGDSTLLTWLASMFTGEAPVEQVRPRRVLSTVPKKTDLIALQISDSEFITISPDVTNPIQVHSNGSYGLMFEHDQVENIAAKDLVEAVREQMNATYRPWWLDVLRDHVNLKDKSEENLILLTALFYMSPWLNRWRGTQLPIELVIGEPGSGKSSLYELRMSILTGKPALRNMSGDIKDWFASVINTGGMHVIDNVKFTNSALRQQISDEICRIITEPNPHIEMRKLFTTSTNARFPVETTFAMTALSQPFTNSDIIQRSAVIQLEAVENQHEGTWVQSRLRDKGGRLQWLAHHIVTIHKFLNHSVLKNEFSYLYKADHRLINYEQSLKIMCNLLGKDNDWVGKRLTGTMMESIKDADWILEGVKAFVDYFLKNNPKGGDFSVQDISEWATITGEYEDNKQLCSSRSLGRYMSSNQAILRKLAGIEYKGMYANKKIYSVGPTNYR